MDIFLSYTHADIAEADKIYSVLSKTEGITISRDTVDLRAYDNLMKFMQSLRGHQYVIQLISATYLKSFNCMIELMEFMKDDSGKKCYKERMRPVLVSENIGGKLDLFSDMGQLSVVTYWQTEKRTLEEGIARLKNELNTSDRSLEPKRKKIVKYERITESILEYLTYLTENMIAPRFEDLVSSHFAELISSLKKTSINMQANIPGIEKLKHLSEGINENSYNDPKHPEYPPFSPRFPATPHRIIKLFGHTIFLKDESYNPTGTHKDRMAWEVVLHYKKILSSKISTNDISSLPSPSLISTGSAAIAVQHQLRLYGLPNLKVLMDKRTPLVVIKRLQSIGCKIYQHDLQPKELNSADVKRITENPEGFDITNRDWLDPNKRTYYDWLSYEIFNLEVDYIFVPVGTGELYENILSILRDEILCNTNDTRLKKGSASLQDITILGATSYDRKTCMDKLFAYHRPTLKPIRELIKRCIRDKICSDKSDICSVKEESVHLALSVAELYNIATEASGIAGLALFIEERKNIPKDKRVLVVNTGWMHLPNPTH